MRLLRLSGRKVCERVKTKGMPWKGKHLQARLLRGAPRPLPPEAAGLFVGVVTSAKLDKSAVRRNRMRRRCREALRTVALAMQPDTQPERAAFPRSVQLLLLPRSSSLTAPFGELQDDARRLLFSLRA